MIKQRTQEWLDSRKGRITGSRLGAILGISPWQKSSDVLREMVREYHGYPSEFKSNIAVDHGVYHETQALLCFQRKTGLIVNDCGFFPYGETMGASPDGITSDDAVFEVKVPFGLRNEKEAKFKTLEEQPHYYAQVQMEMLAAKKSHAYFAQYVPPKGDPFLEHSYIPEQMDIQHIKADPDWIDSVLPELSAFYDLYLFEISNPEHLEPLRVVIDTETVGGMLAEIDQLRARQKDDAEREKELLDAIVTLCDGKNALVHGRKLTLVKRKGAVDYAKLLKDVAPDVDIEKYRKTGSESWRLS